MGKVLVVLVLVALHVLLEEESGPEVTHMLCTVIRGRSGQCRPVKFYGGVLNTLGSSLSLPRCMALIAHFAPVQIFPPPNCVF